MINDITQVLSLLSNYPKRSVYIDADTYGAVVETWLGEQAVISPELIVLIPQLNTFISELNAAGSTINTNVSITNQDVIDVLANKVKAQEWADNEEDDPVEAGEYSAKHWAMKAFNTIEAITDETINDNLIEDTDAWSSDKISTEVDKAILGTLFRLRSKNTFILESGIGDIITERPSGATRVDRQGVLQTAEISESRFENEGYLSECESTNYHIYSNDLSTDTFVNTTRADDGNGGSIISLDPTKTGNAGCGQRTTLEDYAIGDNITISVDAKFINGHIRIDLSSTLVDVYTAIVFDLQNGVVGRNVNNYDAKIKSLGNGYYRCSVSFVTTKASVNPTDYITYTTISGTSSAIYQADGSSSTDLVYVRNAQLERKAFPTSYIPTPINESVTRAGDVTSYDAYDNLPNLIDDWRMCWAGTPYFEGGDTTSLRAIIQNKYDNNNSIQIYCWNSWFWFSMRYAGATLYLGTPATSGQEIGVEVKNISGKIGLYVNQILKDSADFSNHLGISLLDKTYLGSSSGLPNENFKAHTKLHTWEQL